jgi:hypothetical protein
MPIKLQIRRGTAANWTSADPTLLAGEIGYETDTGNFKVGDGTTAWTSLKYSLPHRTGTVAASASSTLSIDQANARIGLGTTSPQAQLHVESAAPVVRLRDSGAAAGVYSAVDGDNTSGSLTITADVGNLAANSTVQIATDSTIRASFTQDGSNNTRVGLGTTSPATALHISTASPIVRLTDTAAAAVYSDIGQDNTTGTVTIAADEGNGAGSSGIVMRVDGADLITATPTAITTASGAALSVGTWTAGTVTSGAIAAGAVTAAKTTFGVERKREVIVSGTTSWTVPSNVYAIRAWLVGGGGGGGKEASQPPDIGGDGGYGGFGCFDALVVPGTVITGVQVGSGGAGTNSQGANGSAGTSTIFAGFTASGGGGGNGGSGVDGANGTFTQGSAPTGVTHVRNNRQWDCSVFTTWAATALFSWDSGAAGVTAVTWAETSTPNPGSRGAGAPNTGTGRGGMSGAIFIEYLVVA